MVERYPDKEYRKEWEAVVDALLTHADNSLARLHELHQWSYPNPQAEGNLKALLRSARTLETFLENSGQGWAKMLDRRESKDTNQHAD